MVSLQTGVPGQSCDISTCRCDIYKCTVSAPRASALSQELDNRIYVLSLSFLAGQQMDKLRNFSLCLAYQIL